MDTSHLNWLQQHRQDPEFLGQALQSGFSLHPLDDDRRNAEADNLVLIYAGDASKLSAPPDEGYSSKSEGCYQLRSSGSTWASVASEMGVSQSNAWSMARNYAKSRNLKWPIR